MSNQIEISRMFSSITRFYEAFNVIASFGLVLVWRARAAAAARRARGPLLDVGVGNGGLSKAIRRVYRGPLVGVDISRALAETAKGVDGLEIVIGDATMMPFRDGAFEGALSAFTLRSLERAGLQETLREVRRILKKGGFISFVDTVRPQGALSSAFFRVYLTLARAFGSLYSSNAYGWLVESIIRLGPEEVDEALMRSGFRSRRERLPGSLAWLWWGSKD